MDRSYKDTGWEIRVWRSSHLPGVLHGGACSRFLGERTWDGGTHRGACYLLSRTVSWGSRVHGSNSECVLELRLLTEKIDKTKEGWNQVRATASSRRRWPHPTSGKLVHRPLAPACSPSAAGPSGLGSLAPVPRRRPSWSGHTKRGSGTPGCGSPRWENKKQNHTGTA